MATLLHPSTEQDEPRAPWLAHYPARVPAHLDYPEQPVGWLLERAANSHPDRIACCFYEQRLTYRELLDAARRCATLLRSVGIQPGDRVGLLVPNVPEYLTAAYGTWLAGGVVVALSPLMVGEEIRDLVVATGCRVVVTLDLLAPLLNESREHLDQVFTATLGDRLPYWQRLGYAFLRLKKIGLAALVGSTHFRSLSDELAACEPWTEQVPLSPESPAYILATGGTTGHPKAVVLSHRNLLANAWQLFHWAGRRYAQDTILAVLPFFHSYGLSTCVTGGVALAGTLVLHQRFQLQAVLKLIERHKPSIFYAVPAMLRAINLQERKKRSDLSSLRWIISGGAALEAEVATEFSGYAGATVVEGFGLSEASPITHVGPLDGTNELGTIGFPLPDTDARIVDAETGRIELPAGEVGELIIRGPQVMLGYWQDADETARAVRDGWLYTGDLATCDANGFFRIVDRKKDLIIVSGYNVYPTDVEAVLKQYPGVADAVVVGVPDAEHGEAVKAVLVLEKSAAFDRKQFDHFVQQHLAKHKRPHLVEVVEGDLPRSFLGKVLRRKLREQSAATLVASLKAAPAAG